MSFGAPVGVLFCRVSSGVHLCYCLLNSSGKHNRFMFIAQVSEASEVRESCSLAALTLLIDPCHRAFPPQVGSYKDLFYES